METILVSGGAGFIGSCLVRHLVQQSAARVVTLDKLTYAGNLDSLDSVLEDPRCVFVEGDISDTKLVGELLATYRPWAIMNLAAESHVDRSIDRPADFVSTNVVGTSTLLAAAQRYWEGLSQEESQRFRFLQVSTDEVYGSLGATGKFTETTPYAPRSPYSASKAAADHFVRAYHHTFGLPTLITNCSNNYGPRQFPEKLIPLMILNAIEGKPLPVYGDGQNIRDWLFVDDHVHALLAVLHRGTLGETYNIGGNAEQSNLDVVKQTCSIVDELRPELPHSPCSNLITFVTDRPGHDRRYAIDSTKIFSQLQWRPLESFDSGLRRTVQWYLDNQHWVERVTTGVYRRERLGLATSPAKQGLG